MVNNQIRQTNTQRLLRIIIKPNPNVILILRDCLRQLRLLNINVPLEEVDNVALLGGVFLVGHKEILIG